MLNPKVTLRVLSKNVLPDNHHMISILTVRISKELSKMSVNPDTIRVKKEYEQH